MTDAHRNNPLARRWADRRRPPDYTQRSVKIRIFLLLALLMLVLAAAERARDPKTWKWLADLRQGDAKEQGVNTRLQPQPLRTAGGDVDTFVTSPHPSSPPTEAKSAEPGAATVPPQSSVERAWQQGWKEVAARIDGQQRTLLFEVLYSAEQHQTLAPDKRNAAAQMLAEANRLWEDYQAAAFQSLVTLPQQDQGEWIDVLRQVNKRWSADVMPSIQAVIDGRTPTGNEALLLAGFQKTLDALVLARVEDNTLFLRPDERDVWLRLEGRARDTDPAALKRESVGQVGYLQLHKQPDEYRGKVVSIRGTVKYAYRTTASGNYLGITDHYVLWIMPDGGPTAPVVVYALGLPAGFPQIDASPDGSMTKLHEEVRVTGFFLKRGAYLGKDGTHTAPLLIANLPDWKPRMSLETTARFGLGLRWLWPAAGAALIAAIVLVGIAYRFSIRNQPSGSQVRSDGPPDLTGITIGPSTADSLRQMEQEQR